MCSAQKNKQWLWPLYNLCGWGRFNNKLASESCRLPSPWILMGSWLLHASHSHCCHQQSSFPIPLWRLPRCFVSQLPRTVFREPSLALGEPGLEQWPGERRAPWQGCPVIDSSGAEPLCHCSLLTRPLKLVKRDSDKLCREVTWLRKKTRCDNHDWGKQMK